MNNQAVNNANNSVTSETAEADTMSSPIVQPSTPQQSTRNENGSNNNSPTGEFLQNFFKNNTFLKKILFYKHTLCKIILNILYTYICDVYFAYLITTAQYVIHNLLISVSKQSVYVSKFYLI